MKLERLQKVTGNWRGSYGYESNQLKNLIPVPFTLKLEQGWLGHFTGNVTEDVARGMPGLGVIDGYFAFPNIEFTKQMPVCYIATPDGQRITLRERLISKGYPCEHDIPHPPIFYEGEFVDANRAEGTWILKAVQIPLPNGEKLPMSEATGIWFMQMEVFDGQHQSLSTTESQFEEKLKEDSYYRKLGRYEIPDAERILKRFEQEKIRFQISADNTRMRQMSAVTASLGGYFGAGSLMEIFVHQDDEVKANQILSDIYKV
jgi:hypothetical protein